MRSIAILFLAAALAGCSKEQAKSPAPEKTGRVVGSATVLSMTEAPGSPFKMAIGFDPPQPVMSKKTNFRLTLSGPSGALVKDAKVHASLVMPLMDMGKNEFDLQSAGNGVYAGTGQFTMSGEWEVVITAVAGNKSGKTTFNVRVED